jgi:hypothetical protein
MEDDRQGMVNGEKIDLQLWGCLEALYLFTMAAIGG